MKKIRICNTFLPNISDLPVVITDALLDDHRLVKLAILFLT